MVNLLHFLPNFNAKVVRSLLIDVYADHACSTACCLDPCVISRIFFCDASKSSSKTKRCEEFLRFKVKQPIITLNIASLRNFSASKKVTKQLKRHHVFSAFDWLWIGRWESSRLENPREDLLAYGERIRIWFLRLKKSCAFFHEKEEVCIIRCRRSTV